LRSCVCEDFDFSDGVALCWWWWWCCKANSALASVPVAMAIFTSPSHHHQSHHPWRFVSFSLATFHEMGLGSSKSAESADKFSVSFLSTDPDLQILFCCLLANCILFLHEA